ncbi:MAG: hypothetical protein V2J24_20125 [Pseudomonadales bacterium]|jgi:hypothetical protein|nr:hypothetical protein [Pseudomonadales bacterium]
MTDAREAAAMVRAWPCPEQCDNGVIPHGPLPDGSWEAQQCQHCDERDRVLAILDAMPEGPDGGWIDAGVHQSFADFYTDSDWIIEAFQVPKLALYRVMVKPVELDTFKADQDLDVTGSDVRGDGEQPHWPTVAAALRQVFAALSELDMHGSMSSFQDALARRAREIEEGRENE